MADLQRTLTLYDKFGERQIDIVPPVPAHLQAGPGIICLYAESGEGVQAPPLRILIPVRELTVAPTTGRATRLTTVMPVPLLGPGSSATLVMDLTRPGPGLSLLVPKINIWQTSGEGSVDLLPGWQFLKKPSLPAPPPLHRILARLAGIAPAGENWPDGDEWPDREGVDHGGRRTCKLAIPGSAPLGSWDLVPGWWDGLGIQNIEARTAPSNGIWLRARKIRGTAPTDIVYCLGFEQKRPTTNSGAVVAIGGKLGSHQSHVGIPPGQPVIIRATPALLYPVADNWPKPKDPSAQPQPARLAQKDDTQAIDASTDLARAHLTDKTMFVRWRLECDFETDRLLELTSDPLEVWNAHVAAEVVGNTDRPTSILPYFTPPSEFAGARFNDWQFVILPLLDVMVTSNVSPPPIPDRTPSFIQPRPDPTPSASAPQAGLIFPRTEPDSVEVNARRTLNAEFPGIAGSSIAAPSLSVCLFSIEDAALCEDQETAGRKNAIFSKGCPPPLENYIFHREADPAFVQAIRDHGAICFAWLSIKPKTDDCATVQFRLGELTLGVQHDPAAAGAPDPEHHGWVWAAPLGGPSRKDPGGEPWPLMEAQLPGVLYSIRDLTLPTGNAAPSSGWRRALSPQDPALLRTGGSTVVIPVVPNAQSTRITITEGNTAPRGGASKDFVQGPSSLVAHWLQNAQRSDTPLELDSIIINLQPFSIARIRANLSGLAMNDDDSDIGVFADGYWSLVGTRAVRMLMPPQVIGEDMIRGDSADTGDAALANFRFSPPAHLTIDQAEDEVSQARAPWLIGDRIRGGDPVAGVALTELQSELLYGLPFMVRRPGLRVASLLRRRGWPWRAWLDTRPTRTDVMGQAFTDATDNWKRVDATVASMIQVLEVFDPLAPNQEHLTIDRDATWRLRTTAHLADPTCHAARPIPTLDLADNKTLLKAGVTYGFETSSALESFVKDARRGSTTGAIKGLFLSPLGASGEQTVEFENGITRIESTTEQGVVTRYVVSRLGRIGMLWNPARHVVVYERTSVPNPRYTWKDNPRKQPKQVGRAFLRKTDEYVELVKPTREYPDVDAEAEAPAFLKGNDFGTGEASKFRVEASWGSDVLDAGGNIVGWKVPLWIPEDEQVATAGPEPADLPNDPSRSRIHPKPCIACMLHTQRPDLRPDPFIVDDPQKLFFFTKFFQGELPPNANTDEWPAVATVDFPDLPEPLVSGANTHDLSDADRTLPDEQEHAPGHEAFTLTLLPGPRPAVVNHARQSRPLFAEIRNITLARGQNKTEDNGSIAKLKTLVDAHREAVAAGAAALRAATNALALLAANRTMTQASTKKILDEWVGSFNNTLTGFKGASDAISGTFGNDSRAAQLLDSLSKSVNNSRTEATARATRVFAKFKNDLVGLQARIDHGDQDAKALKERLLWTAAEVVLVGNNPMAPVVARVTRWLASMQTAITQSQACLDEAITHFNQLITDLESQSRASSIETWIESLPRNRDRLLARLRLVERQIAEGLAELPAERQKLINAVHSLTAAITRLTIIALAFLRNLKDSGPDLNVVAELKKQLEPDLKILKDAVTNCVIAGIDNTLVPVVSAAANDIEAHLLRMVANATAGPSDPHENIISEAKNRFTTAKAAVKDAIDNKLDIAVFVRVFNELNAAYAIASLPLASILVANTKKWEETAEVLAQNFVKTLYDGFAISPAQEQAMQALCGVATLAEDAKDRALALIDDANKRLKDARTQAESLLAAASDVKAGVRAAQDLLTQATEDIHRQAGAALDNVHALERAVQKQDIFAVANASLSLRRAFGHAPRLPGLEFNRDKIAYHLKRAQSLIRTTPMAALLDRAGDQLKAMGMRVPSVELGEHLIPKFDNLDLATLFPDLAGLKLGKLFPDLKLPSLSTEHVKIKHHFDPKTRTAWVTADAQVPFSAATVLDTGPLKISVANARLTAHSEIRTENGHVSRFSHGRILADWVVSFGSQSFVRFADTSLVFDSSGHMDFDLRPERVKLIGLLGFLSDKLKSLVNPDSNGLHVINGDNGVPRGVQVLFSIPVPDTQGVTTGFSGLTMGARFLLQLGATPKDLINDFELGVGFSLAKREKPFNISAFILGGAGHLDMYAAYLPFRPRLSATVDLSINASASLAISFAGITGGVYAYLGINLNFTAAIGGPSRFVIDARLMFQGVVDIWGIVSASITIEFLLRYNSDERRLVAIGRLRVRIKICWCFTISINMQVTLPPGASAGPDSASLAPAHLRNDLALEFTRARLALLA